MKLNIYKIEVKFHVDFAAGQCLYQQVVYCYLLIANFILIVSNQKTNLNLRWKINKQEGILGFDYIVCSLHLIRVSIKQGREV